MFFLRMHNSDGDVTGTMTSEDGVTWNIQPELFKEAIDGLKVTEPDTLLPLFPSDGQRWVEGLKAELGGLEQVS